MKADVFFSYCFFPQKYKAPNHDNHDDTDKEDTSMESRSDDEELGEISVRNCAICLETFNPNDNVCTSNNDECQHGKSFVDDTHSSC